MSICWSCGEGDIIVDPDSGAHVCNACAMEHSAGDFRPETFDRDGRPLTSLVHSGDFTYRERKYHNAKTLISTLTSQLGLSAPRAAEAAAMVVTVTDGTYGAGDWFPVLVAACSYLVMRRHSLPLSIAEVAAVVSRDAHEIGRMASRIASHLDLEPLPEFDSEQSLIRAVRSCPCFTGLGEEKAEEIIGQGRFLLQCATRWFLTTGRQPLPMVAAIVVFVAEVNGVAVRLEEIAKDIYACVSTCNLRLKELRETLIKVARVLLPWGADVTAKNLTQNAPMLIRLMELKSRKRLTTEGFEDFGIDMDGLVDVCANQYGDEEDAKYSKAGDGDGVLSMSCEEMNKVKLSEEALSLTYKNVLERLAQIKERGGLGKDLRNTRKRGRFDLGDFKDSWQMEGRWEADKGLTLEEVLQKDVGYDALPPSFVSGVEARRIRRTRIEAARSRIQKIKMPLSAANTLSKESRTKSLVGRKKRRKGVEEGCMDWEDCIIELLLLHGVAEDEIEQGQYRRLLDLHIFNSLST